MQTITIKVHDKDIGVLTRTVPATIVGSFAVHRPAEPYARKLWAISHPTCGLRYAYARTRKDGLRGAAELEALPTRWDLLPDGLSQDEKRQAFNAVLDLCHRGIWTR